MKIKHVACYFLIFLLSGCAVLFQKRILSYSRNDKYLKFDFGNQKVFIAPIFRENIFVSNVEDAADDFKESKLAANELVMKNYVPIFLDSLKSSIKKINAVVLSETNTIKYEEWAGLESKEIELEVGDNHVLTKFRIPTKASLKKFGFEEDILVAIEQLAFNRNSVQMGKAGQEIPVTRRLKYSYEYDYIETKESASLGAKANVIIWNYKENEGIFYGTVTEKTVFRLVMQRKHWDESADRLSKKIIRLTKSL